MRVPFFVECAGRRDAGRAFIDLGEQRLNFRIRVPAARLILQDEIRSHAAAREIFDALVVFGAVGVGIKVLAGLVLASRLGAGVPNAGLQYELDVIAATAVGGTSLTGGRGSVIGTLWGAVFIGVLNNGLNLAGVDPYMQRVALGVVLLLAVLADQAGKTQGEEMAARWVKMADDGDHYRLAFDKPGTWSRKYNLVWDTLLDIKVLEDDALWKKWSGRAARQRRSALMESCPEMHFVVRLSRESVILCLSRACSHRVLTNSSLKQFSGT